MTPEPLSRHPFRWSPQQIDQFLTAERAAS